MEVESKNILRHDGVERDWFAHLHSLTHLNLDLICHTISDSHFGNIFPVKATMKETNHRNVAPAIDFSAAAIGIDLTEPVGILHEGWVLKKRRKKMQGGTSCGAALG